LYFCYNIDMAEREVIVIPHETLNSKADKVKEFNSELHTLIDDMVDTMRAAPGVGLAAPQVNVRQRVIVVEYGDDEEEEEAPTQLYSVVNPVVSRRSKETVTGIEGCLSIPDYVGEVERAAEVTVKGQDRHGKPMKIKAKGWLARIFQHEVDHLDGILFLERAERIFKLEELEDILEEEVTGFD
jgi:peptide deformylase